MSIYETVILICTFATMARAGRGASGRDRYGVSKTDVFETALIRLSLRRSGLVLGELDKRRALLPNYAPT
jgi:hypothetical protein